MTEVKAKGKVGQISKGSSERMMGMKTKTKALAEYF
jgi:hypothetical protein